MFKVWLVNFGWYADGTFPTLADALAAAKRGGFEAAIHGPQGVVAGWSIFGGTRYYTESK